MVSVFCAKASIHVLNRSLGLVSGVEPDEERTTGWIYRLRMIFFGVILGPMFVIWFCWCNGLLQKNECATLIPRAKPVAQHTNTEPRNEREHRQQSKAAAGNNWAPAWIYQQSPVVGLRAILTYRPTLIQTNSNLSVQNKADQHPVLSLVSSSVFCPTQLLMLPRWLIHKALVVANLSSLLPFPCQESYHKTFRKQLLIFRRCRSLISSS